MRLALQLSLLLACPALLGCDYLICIRGRVLEETPDGLRPLPGASVVADKGEADVYADGSYVVRAGGPGFGPPNVLIEAAAVGHQPRAVWLRGDPAPGVRRYRWGDEHPGDKYGCSGVDLILAPAPGP